MEYFKLKTEKSFQYIKMNFGELMSKITPKYKMRDLYLWWYHDVHGNAYRRIIEINKELFARDSSVYECNFCHKVVFKGSIKYGIILNCPYCKRQFSVIPEPPHKFKKLSFIRIASNNTDEISVNSKLIR